MRDALGIPTGMVVIGSVGRLDIVKGHDLLIEAAGRVRAAGMDAVYLIVGEGVEAENLRDQARRLGLVDRVLFPGYRQDVRACLSLIDIFVLRPAVKVRPWRCSKLWRWNAL